MRDEKKRGERGHKGQIKEERICRRQVGSQQWGTAENKHNLLVYLLLANTAPLSAAGTKAQAPLPAVMQAVFPLCLLAHTWSQ